jgi:hypothetical protein
MEERDPPSRSACGKRSVSGAAVPKRRRAGGVLRARTQLPAQRVGGIDYFVTGGGGKVRESPPSRFVDAGTVSWAAVAHFLIVRVENGSMTAGIPQHHTLVLGCSRPVAAASAPNDTHFGTIGNLGHFCVEYFNPCPSFTLNRICTSRR